MLDLFMATAARISTAAKLVVLQLRGVGDEGDDATAEPVDDAPLLAHVGFAVWPKIQRTLRVLGYRYGDEVFALHSWDKASAPSDLEAGETRPYAAGWPLVHIRLFNGLVDVRVGGDAGVMKLASDTAAFNNAKVSRVGDATAGHNHLPGTYLAGPWAVQGLSATQIDHMAEGAENVRA